MALLGIDLGTTTLSAVVLDASTRAVIHSETMPGPGFLPAPEPWARCQDADALIHQAQTLYSSLLKRFNIEAVALTGQMHGVIPINAQGQAIGPLYTWQDGRGALEEEGVSFCRRLSGETGCALFPGYGLVTHAYNLRHNLAEEGAAFLTTAAGYLGMRLTGRRTPLLHASDAASLGGYDIPGKRFYDSAVRAANNTLPDVTDRAEWLGRTREGIPVCVAIGDNQASFLGAVDDPLHSLLVNIGTGSQVSVCSDHFIQNDAFDTRPFTDGRFLLVASPLCGGRSYALLERFIRACAALGGANPQAPLYDAMNALAMTSQAHSLSVDTRFCGTRREPNRRGAITNLSEDSFTPAHMIRGMLEGMAQELYEGYQAMTTCLDSLPQHMVASGNGVGRNPALQAILSETFALPLTLSPYREEAARGAALFALTLL